MMAWWKRFGRRAATLLLTVLMLLGAAAGEGAVKTVINRNNAPDVTADIAFAEDADLRPADSGLRRGFSALRRRDDAH